MVVQGDTQMVRVNTEKYEASWGKKPRGYGLWWFRIGTEDFTSTGTYSNAAKDAVAMARVLRQTEVVVLP